MDYSLETEVRHIVVKNIVNNPATSNKDIKTFGKPHITWKKKKKTAAIFQREATDGNKNEVSSSNETTI